MPILLTVATSKELYSILPELTEQNIAEHAPALFCKNKHDFIICITGIGPINAGIALGRVLEKYPDISGVLNLGLAGTFNAEKAPLGSCVVVTEEIWPEYGLNDGQSVDAKNFGFALLQSPNQSIINSISLCTDFTVLKLAALAQIIEGKALTVAGVSATKQRCQALKEQYSPLIENMEGFAVALACKRQNIPLIELRTVSNLVGSRAKENWNFSLAFANMHIYFNELIN